MRNKVFVYLEIYSVYLKIFDYGVLVQGVRFPLADEEPGPPPTGSAAYRAVLKALVKRVSRLETSTSGRPGPTSRNTDPT